VNLVNTDTTPWSVIHSSESVEWETPQGLYRVLDDQFCFDLDAAASSSNTKCAAWFDQEDDALAQDWCSPTSWHSSEAISPAEWRSVWLNPPYGRELKKWLKKAYWESRRGLTVVVLVMSCTETTWWWEYVARATQVRFLPGRLKFTRADGHTGPAPKGSAVVVFTPWWSGPPQYINWDYTDGK
jgi:site-specific DNA-methyltransferase (adenine-specific)